MSITITALATTLRDTYFVLNKPCPSVKSPEFMEIVDIWQERLPAGMTDTELKTVFTQIVQKKSSFPTPADICKEWQSMKFTTLSTILQMVYTVFNQHCPPMDSQEFMEMAILWKDILPEEMTNAELYNTFIQVLREKTSFPTPADICKKWKETFAQYNKDKVFVN